MKHVTQIWHDLRQINIFSENEFVHFWHSGGVQYCGNRMMTQDSQDYGFCA